MDKNGEAWARFERAVDKSVDFSYGMAKQLWVGQRVWVTHAFWPFEDSK